MSSRVFREDEEASVAFFFSGLLEDSVRLLLLRFSPSSVRSLVREELFDVDDLLEDAAVEELGSVSFRLDLVR